LSRLEVTGSPTPLLDGITAGPGDASAQFSFAENGELMYVPGHSGFRFASIYWMDRQGKFTPIRETKADYYMPALSPDGKRLVVAINDGKKSDIWVCDIAHDTLTRLTFSGNNLSPIWTPDGQRITYVSFEKVGVGDIYWTRADGTGSPFRLTGNNLRKFPSSWHPGVAAANREAVVGNFMRDMKIRSWRSDRSKLVAEISVHCLKPFGQFYDR
jgi:Tol biopolymer transport system component